jgi:hypothetical protein
VSCPASGTCWVAGGLVVALTTDAGASWTVDTPTAWSGTSLKLDSIDCPTSTTCYAAGSTDGLSPAIAKLSSASWSLLTVPSGSYELLAISCATTSACAAVGGNPYEETADSLASSDGGTSWTAATASNDVETFTSVSCSTASNCFATAQQLGGYIWYDLSSTDGGKKWAESGGSPGQYGGIDCRGSQLQTTQCLQVGGMEERDPYVTATADGGQHWYNQYLPAPGVAIPNALSCANNDDCWAVVSGGLWVTTDGGKSQSFGASDTVLASYPAKPMVGEVAFLLAIVTEAADIPVDYVTFSFDGEPLSFCSDAEVTPVQRSTRQAYALCSLIYLKPGSFTLGSSYTGDYYARGSAAAVAVPIHTPGYRFVAADGGIFSFGGLGFKGSVPGAGVVTEEVVGMAPDLDSGGYWVASSDGGLFSFAAPFKGSASGHITAPITAMAVTNDSLGYWLAGADGNVYAFGDASYEGRVVDVPSSVPIVGIAASPLGDGYWLVDRDGNVYAFGSAASYGDLNGHGISDIIGIASNSEGDGYWLTGDNGAVYAFGKAGFYGSEGGVELSKPIVGLAADPATGGYWLVGADGGIFAFHAPFYGSTGAIRLNQPIVGMATG